MNRSLVLNLSRIILLSLTGLVLSFFLASNAFSQDASPAGSPAPTAAEFTFPIEDLGGCADLASCTSFCEDPVNHNTCSDFAHRNGFYADDVTTYGDTEFYQNTQAELGCNSADSCFTFCSDPGNHASCDTFANRNEIPGGYTAEPDNPEYLQIAQSSLGCDSAASCSTYCDDPSNASACTDFAHEVGFLGGTTNEGPGGCQSGETCGAYCSDPANYGECSAHQGENFTGPGGCTDEASCRSYCDQNPDSCRSFAPGSNGAYVPPTCPAGQYHGPGGACTPVGDTQTAVACVGSDQYWDGTACHAQPPVGIDPELPSAHFEERPEMGGCTTPGTCFDFCQANPDSCPGFDASGSRPTDEYTPNLYYTPGTEITNEPIEAMGGCTSPASCFDYCSDNPDSCPGFNETAPRPPEIYIPETYFTPPTDTEYVTPPVTFFYTTPIYPTPPDGSTYTTPQYYTPGMYSTPSYITPSDPVYITPNYYTPWENYTTPTGEYPTPTYASPTYYTPPGGTNYATPYYYTPPMYTSPQYYSPGGGYTTPPTYVTPPPYTTPQYYTPYRGGDYTTPVYYTPISYNTPYYPTPRDGFYTTPPYYTPPPPYITPTYFTPFQYPTPPIYITPNYPTPRYFSPPTWWRDYPTPNYVTPPPYSTPPEYHTPPQYITPSDCSSGTCQYPTPQYPSPYISPYPYPTPGQPYPYPTPSFPGGCTDCTYYTPQYSYPYPTPGEPYSYPSPSYTPGTPYGYPTPDGYYYPTPAAGTYGTPTGGDGAPHYPYPTPTYGYPSPTYGTPSETYGTPAYGTPAYGTPAYGTPSEYHTPSGETHGVSTNANPLELIWNRFWNVISGK
ncbi:MAG: hypothetical protein CEO21_138 [Microgenomates group bacterium Gr01-1014_80]|nr:MAG: hypothetical protein CEO21_138 [Microgenomates group bacterium Gr01-1014_80]